MNGFSIILPTFRRPDTLQRAIKSVKAQVHKDWELIIVDNDKKNYDGFDDDRIKYVVHEERGVCNARNFGIGLATKDIVTFLDDDDMLHPAYLYRFDAMFSLRPRVKMARCGMRLRLQDIYSLFTIQVATRREYVKPEWITHTRHDQIYFTKIMDDNGWHMKSPEFADINEVLCYAMHASHGGLRDEGGKL